MKMNVMSNILKVIEKDLYRLIFKTRIFIFKDNKVPYYVGNDLQIQWPRLIAL